MTISHARYGFPAQSFTASGLAGVGQASGTGSGATWTLQPGAVPTGTQLVTFPTTIAPPISGQEFAVFGNATGTFAAGTPGAMAVSLSWKVQAFGGIGLLPPGGTLPASIGTPTTTTFLCCGVFLSWRGTSWTTGMVTLATTSSQAALVTQGSNSLLAGAGAVTMVTPIHVAANTAGLIPMVATLTLHFVPEPGTGVLAVTGAALLAAAGARRSRR